MQETQVRSLGQEDPPDKGLATHSSILAGRTPWTEETGGLQSTGSQNWVIHTHTCIHAHTRMHTCTHAYTLSLYVKCCPILSGFNPGRRGQSEHQPECTDWDRCRELSGRWATHQTPGPTESTYDGPKSLSTSLHWAASKGDLPCSPLKHSIYPGSHGQTLQVPPAGSWQGRNEWGGFTGAGIWGAHAPLKRGITSHSSCWPTLRNADPVWMYLPGTQESQKIFMWNLQFFNGGNQFGKKKKLSVLTKRKSSVCLWAVVCKIWPEPFWSKWYPASLKQTVLCRTVYSWKEIGISLEIAIFVGHEMVEYPQLYVVPCNITAHPRLKCSGWSFIWLWKCNTGI